MANFIEAMSFQRFRFKFRRHIFKQVQILSIFSLLSLVVPAYGEQVFLSSTQNLSEDAVAKTQQFYVVEAVKDGWLLAKFEKHPGSFQTKVREWVLENKKFAAEKLHEICPDCQPSEDKIAESKSFETEVEGEVLWEPQDEWSGFWEDKYARWVENEVDEDFFYDNRIATDCADVAFALRWIFARKNLLPIASRLVATGQVFSHVSMRKEWESLPTAKDWNKDRRFLAALDYILDQTFTHSLMRDSYPIGITSVGLVPGSYFLNLSGDSGHTQVIYRTPVSTRPSRWLETLESDVPRRVRSIWNEVFYRTSLARKDRSAFLKMRWPVKVAGSWTLLEGTKMPDYSEEQFNPEFMEGFDSFDEAVVARLRPNGRIPVEQLESYLATLISKFQNRKQVVEEGWAICSAQFCKEDSAEYDAWSTPSRDATLESILIMIEQLVQRFQSNRDVRERWQLALAQEVVEIQGHLLKLGDLRAIWRGRSYSSDPNDSVGRRWGLE